MSDLRPLRPPRRIVYPPRTLGGNSAPPKVPPNRGRHTVGDIRRPKGDWDAPGGSPPPPQDQAERRIADTAIGAP